MSTAIFVQLARQDGLVREMDTIANNLANASTTGYRSDAALFTEYIAGRSGSADSLSIGMLGGHAFSDMPGALRLTGGAFDLALQGDGYFLLETDRGQRLSRAGHFQLDAEGRLVDAFGNRVLAEGGNPIVFPPGAQDIRFGADGIISAGDFIVDRLAVMMPNGELRRDGGTFFEAPGGFAPIGTNGVTQGALEQSNVSPVLQVSRMIEVQRAYEFGQTLLEREDRRIEQVLKSTRDG